MNRLLVTDARVLTLAGGSIPRRGKALGELSALDHHDVWIRDGKIERLEPTSEGRTQAAHRDTQVIQADGRVLLPAFVDCHTHTCWAGNRLAEWQRKLAGATYLELLGAGGGIMSTVRAVRAATEKELADLLLARLNRMLECGTMAVEVKSGYGLSTEMELKMLRSIVAAGDRWVGQVMPTACIGHALDPDVARETFIATTIEETLPAVNAEFPKVPIDAYCEEGAWTVDECLRLFDAAQAVGHPIRVHADQFHSLGMIDEATRRNYRSVDHLEATDHAALARLAESECFGVMLPCCGFHLDERYGDGRAFVSAGGALAIATNYNPGSAPCFSLPMAMAIAVRHLGLSVAESLAACTVNAAALLGLDDRGTIQPEKRADLLLLDTCNEAQLAFEFASPPIAQVIAGGRPLLRTSPSIVD
jgi:imidazolonepropionase